MAKDPRLEAHLDALLEPTVSGSPESPLRWTSKSIRRLADELNAMSHDAGYQIVKSAVERLSVELKAVAPRVQQPRGNRIETRSSSTRTKW